MNLEIIEQPPVVPVVTPRELQPVSEDTWSLLAGLRFFFAFAVMSEHVQMVEPFHTPILFIAPFGGVSAVFAFLVISGFSIANSVERNPKGFYSRRLDRIVPVFVASFVLATVPYMIWGNSYTFTGDPPTLNQLIGNFFLLTGFAVNELPTFRPEWSLAVEMACYALAPFLLKLRALYLLAITACSMLFFVIFARCSVGDVSVLSNGIMFARMFWIWVIGYLLYRRRSDILFTCLALAIMCAALAFSSTTNAEYRCTPIVFVIVVMLIDVHLTPLVKKVLNFLGDLSYPLYLVHWPILCLFWGWKNVDANLVVASSLVTSLAILFAVDYPFRAYRRKRR